MNEGPLPFFAPGADPGLLLRRPAAPGRPRSPPPPSGMGARRAVRDHARHDRRRDPLRRRRRHGRRPAGDGGLHDRQPPDREGVRRRRLSGVAIAGAAGPAVEMVRLFQVQLQHYEKIEGEQLSLEGKANQLAQMVRANLPGGDAGLRRRPAVRRLRRPPATRAASSASTPTGGKYEEADYQTNGSGGVHARNWIKAQLARGHDAATTPSTSRSGRCSPPPTRTSRPAVPTSCGGIYPTVAVIDADGFRAGRRRRIAAPGPGAPRRTRGGERACEHAVLRLARAGHEGPGGLRPEGHRPRTQPRCAQCADGVLILAENP